MANNIDRMVKIYIVVFNEKEFKKKKNQLFINIFHLNDFNLFFGTVFRRLGILYQMFDNFFVINVYV